MLERLYGVFPIVPFGSPRIRAVTKAQKHYHYDRSLVPANGPRFENLVTGHRLRWVHYRREVLSLDLRLRHFRARDGREVDFIVVEQRRPALKFVAQLV